MTITVVDDEQPAITCPADIVVVNDAGACNADVTVPAPQVDDNCAVASVTNDYNGTDDASDNYPVGTTLVEWTVTDIHGNTNTCTVAITVEDNEAPALTCPTDITVNSDAGNCGAMVSVPAPAMADNCAVASVTNDYTSTDDASGEYPVGVTTVVWTLTDIHGNSSQCQMTVTVVDLESPAITCPTDISVNNDNGHCDAFVSVAAPQVSDNCTVASAVNDYNGTADASDTYPVGVTTVTWTVTDIYGNTASCTQAIEVNDTEAPGITCPANLSANTDPGVCEAYVTVAAPAVSDNCGVASVTNDYTGNADASAVYPTGVTTVTFTVSDIHGNVSTCSMTITVVDNELPAADCAADITVTNDMGVCEAFVSVPAPAVTDNCGIASVINDFTGTDNADGIYPQGITLVTWTVTDTYGNAITCTMSVTVNDTEAPAITCPDDVLVSTDAGVCEAFVTVPVPAIDDNCDVASLVNNYTGSDDASAVYPQGTTVVEWTLTDVHGNTSTCTMEVVVADTEAPVVTCPADISVTSDDALCAAFVNVPVPAADDNCGVASVINDYNNSADASADYPVGITVVTWTVTDIHGNTSSCTMSIEVIDAELPAITCAADISVFTDSGVCEAFVNVAAPATSDNCQVLSVINDYNGTDDASDIYPEGTTAITWTVTDIYGNSSTCVQLVQVIDNENPVVTCPADMVVESDETGCSALVSVSSPAVADNCAVAGMVNDYTGTDDASAVYPVGSTLVTWTLTDVHGNTSTCSMTVTVVDTEVPSILCPDDITITMDEGTCQAFVTVPAPLTSDNCSVLSVTNNVTGTDDASGIYPAGETTVTWTVIDIYGNTSNCAMIINVIDTELPVVTCPENAFEVNQPGLCESYVTVNAPVATDNCGNVTITNNFNGGNDASGVYPVGVTAVTWTITDDSGNVSTCLQLVTVNDIEVPVSASCDFEIVVANDLDACGALVTYELPVITDNCALQDTVLINGLESGAFFPVGSTTVTYTFTDIHGNSMTCSFTVTVEDTQLPEIICTGDLEISSDPGQCGAIVNYSEPLFTDNCSAGTATAVLVEGLPSGAFFEVGVTQVVYEVTDDAGNVTECGFTVTVYDVEAPQIECPEDIVQVDPIVVFSDPAVTDNCSVEMSQIDGLPSGDVFPHGYTTVTYVAVDPAGLADTCSFVVLVNTPPVAEDDEAFYTEENNEISIDVTDNDYDLDGDSIFVSGAWSAGGNLVTINGNNLEYSTLEGWCGTDTVTYVLCDTFNACDTAIVIVNVECFVDLILPQGISPNGDGVNDTFEIIGLEDFPNNTLAIFNRWGHRVFRASQYQNDWDGRSHSAMTIGDALLPKGTYFYVLDLGNGQFVKGYVYLNR
jgi:gliding motility-associated-like protein